MGHATSLPHPGTRRGLTPCAERGLSLLELVVAMALTLVLAGLGLAAAETLRQRAEGLAAARYLAGRLMATRLAAIETAAGHAIWFEETSGGFVFRQLRDANGNGVRLGDVADGIDHALHAERLADRFPQALIGLVASVTDEGGAPLPAGSPPVTFVPGGLASFRPTGTGSSGTVYVGTRKGRQFAVRLYGPTGRLRVLEYDPGGRQWVPR